MNSNITWIVVSCPSVEEATTIGQAVLEARLASCFDIVPRLLARSFWPPRRGTTEDASGALLIIETFEEAFRAVERLVYSLHSDTLPFVGALKMERVRPDYAAWMRGEISPAAPRTEDAS